MMAWDEFGYRFGDTSLMRRLVADIDERIAAARKAS